MNQTARQPKATTGTDYDAIRRDLASAGHDPATQALLAWLIDTAEARRWPLYKLAADIGTSGTTLTRLIKGTYQASTDRVMGLIAAFRARCEARATVAEAQFVETTIAHKVWQAIDYAATYQEIVSVIGHSQWGKTTACEEYQRRRYAEGSDAVIIVRMPVIPSPTLLCSELCRALGITTRLTHAKAVEAIKRTVSSRHVLIIDECHQAATGRQRGINTIETLREIYDCTHCGMVLVGTNVWGRILDGRQLAEWQGVLGQTVLRGISVQLPPRLGYADMQAIWQSFGLANPDQTTLRVVQDIVGRYGLGRYVKRLRSAATAAARKGVTLEWTHVLAVHRQLEELAGGGRGDD